MSHHLDSPEARRDARLDISDLYVFRGERGFVRIPWREGHGVRHECEPGVLLANA
jgi:hypothetical protein